MGLGADEAVWGACAHIVFCSQSYSIPGIACTADLDASSNSFLSNCCCVVQRVEANEDWSLFCPNEAPGLAEVWGDEFDKLYTHYEEEGRARKVVRAQQLWFAVLEAQIETGNPYMLYKDSCNRKSNQQNLGTIKCSNLCTGGWVGLLRRQ